MKKNNKNTIITVITASLLLLATGCSQAAETVDIIVSDTTSDSSVTTINTEAETSAATAARATAAQTITAAQTTTAVTAVPVTEAQSVTVQTEAAPAPVTNPTTAAPVAVTPKTTTTTTTPKPEEPVQEDRSYLNLTPSEVQGILDECQKYAESLGYRKVTYNEYLTEMDELTQKAIDLYKNTGISQDEAYEKVGWYEWEKSMCITDVPADEFWSGGWHIIMYAGDFTKKYENVFLYNGYDSCSTKEESIRLIIDYLKRDIDEEHGNGRSVCVAGTKLKTFDAIIKDCDWGIMNGEDVREQYATGNFIYDINTSYAFAVSRW